MRPDTLSDNPASNSTQNYNGRTLAELILWGEEELKELGPAEARLNAEILLFEISGMDRTKLYLESSKILSPEKTESYRNLIAKRKNRIPLAYLTGRAHFWEETLEVNPGCLIPRPETEILIESFLRHSGFSKDKTFSFLDLGSGSGAIGIALLREFKNSRAAFCDISPDALKVTANNICRYELGSRTEIFISDLFHAFEGRKWDAIFSNPPYFAKVDWNWVEPEISYEPKTALNGGEDGLEFYRNIAKQAGNYLKPKGWLVLEMGIDQAPKVKELLAQNGFCNLGIFKDHGGIDRVIMAQNG